MENEAGTNEGTKVDANSQVSSSPDSGQDQNASSGERDAQGQGQSQDNQPFDKHPAWIRREETWNKRFQKQDREWSRKFQDMQTDFEGRLKGLHGREGEGLDPAQEQALEQLFSLAFKSPRVSQIISERLGVKDISDLKKQVGELSNTWYGSQADSEMESLKDYAKNLGLNPEEVEESILNAIEEHPIYSQVSYKPGAYKAVFHSLYFDKAGEFRERAANQKAIKERENLKRGQTQGSSSSQGASGKKSDNPDHQFQEVLKSAGGLSGIDFTR